MEDIWVSTTELIEMGVSESTILRRVKAAQSGEWVSRCKSEGRRGKPRKEYLLSSLPGDIQRQWVKRNIVSETSDLPAPELKPQQNPLDRLNAQLKRFPLDERERWITELNRLAAIVERYDNLSPKRLKNADGKYEFVPEVFALCEEAKCTDPAIISRESRRAQCPSPFTLDGWLRDYKKDSLLAFIRTLPASGETNEDGRKAEISEPAFEWVNQNWRRFRSPAHLYKETLKRAKKEGWAIPSQSWFYRRWKEMPKLVLTYHLEGEKAYQSKLAPYIPRTAADLGALQLVCGDHSQRDVTVVWRDGKTLVRPWLTLWQDIRTGLLWGWHLDISPSSRTIGLAYLNGVHVFGAQPPGSTIYTDRGRDYKSFNVDGTITVHKQAANLDGGMELVRKEIGVGICNDFDVEQLLSRVRNAKEKPVERTHRDISDWEMNTFDDWCGRDAKFKPDQWVQMWHEHISFVKGKRGESPFMSFDDYLLELDAWITEYNNSEHERSVLNGARIVPADELQRLYTNRFTISEESLALLLMKAEKRTIRKIGVTCSAAYKTWHYFHPAMSEFKGAEVEIRFDDNDLKRVWVVLPNGALCEAELVAKSGYLTPNKQTAALIKQTEKRERKIIRDHNLLTGSVLRGDTLEERIAAEYEIEEEEVPIAVEANGGAVIRRITKMDRPKLRAVPRTRAVSVAEVTQISQSTDESIFNEDEGERGRVREFDFDE